MHGLKVFLLIWFPFRHEVHAWTATAQPSGLSSSKILELAQTRYGRPNSLVPLKGRVVIVTGAAGGIGQEVCKICHRLGGTVVALDCNRVGLDKLRQKCPGLTFFETDHGDLQSVVGTAHLIRESFDRVDILLNNAGITYHQGTAATSSNGHDLAFTINYSSHFLLTKLLQPMLDSDARVIQLTSSYHWKVNGIEITPFSDRSDTAPLASRITNLSPRHVDRSYPNTKLAQIWHAQELHRRYGIHAISVCPTWVGTNIGGKENRDVLRKLAFDPKGSGITSTLNAMLRSNDELGRDVLAGKKMVANSKILDLLLPLKLLLTSSIVQSQDGWRDTIGDFVGLILLAGQRFTHSEFLVQDPSPEATQHVTEMKGLYDWSESVLSPQSAK